MRKMSVISESNESDYQQVKEEFDNREKEYQKGIGQLKMEIEQVNQ